MQLEESVRLGPKTTFRIGGAADYFLKVSGVDELKEAVLFSRRKNIPFFVIGEGSNVLVSDRGFRGLVIKISSDGITWKEGGDEVVVTAQAGKDWDEFVSECISRGWHGLENLSGIPGTIGAAPIQNIGAYGSEISSFIKYVTVLDSKNNEIKILTKDDCGFSYRDSIFKKTEGKNLIVLSISLTLSKKPNIVFSHPDNEAFLRAKKISEKEITPKILREAVLEARKSKLPDLSKFGTAGSFFKNPEIPVALAEKLSLDFPDMPQYATGTELVKIPAAYLIEKAGFKGRQAGKAGVYERHALVLVNHGGASSAEIKKLSSEITESVLNMSGIKLEPEVVFVGEF